MYICRLNKDARRSRLVAVIVLLRLSPMRGSRSLKERSPALVLFEVGGNLSDLLRDIVRLKEDSDDMPLDCAEDEKDASVEKDLSVP